MRFSSHLVTVWRFERLGVEAVYIYIMGNEAKDFVLRTAIFCCFLFFVYFGVTMTAITSQVVKNHADGSMTKKRRSMTNFYNLHVDLIDHHA